MTPLQQIELQQRCSKLEREREELKAAAAERRDRNLHASMARNRLTYFLMIGAFLFGMALGSTIFKETEPALPTSFVEGSSTGAECSCNCND